MGFPQPIDVKRTLASIDNKLSDALEDLRAQRRAVFYAAAKSAYEELQQRLADGRFVSSWPQEFVTTLYVNDPSTVPYHMWSQQEGIAIYFDCASGGLVGKLLPDDIEVRYQLKESGEPGFFDSDNINFSIYRGFWRLLMQDNASRLT